jgi:hypothetical protein
VKAEVLDEPELEFGGGNRHIDPRFGIATYGPADLLTPDAPRAVRIGLIGPADQLDGLGTWLERCREPIPAKDERYPHLFPEFPGCDIDVGLHSTLVLSDRNTKTISPSTLRAIENAPTESGLLRAVDAYAEEIVSLAEENRVDVLLVARPEQLADVTRRGTRRTPQPTGANDKAFRASRIFMISSRRGYCTCASRSRSSGAAPGTKRAVLQSATAGRMRPAARGTCMSRFTTRPAACRGGCCETQPT